MRKLYLCTIPKSLAVEQKCRLDVAMDWFEQCIADPNNFLVRVITGDESWFFECDPSDQQANMAYMKDGKPNLKTLPRSRSNIKSTLILFFNRHGIVHHKLFLLSPEARGINGQCYLNILKWLHGHIARVRPELFATNSWVLPPQQCASAYVVCCGRLVNKKWNDPNVKAGLHRYANTNAACKNDAYVHVGKFVNCSAFAEAANLPYINVL